MQNSKTRFCSLARSLRSAFGLGRDDKRVLGRTSVGMTKGISNIEHGISNDEGRMRRRDGDG